MQGCCPTGRRTCLWVWCSRVSCGFCRLHRRTLTKLRAKHAETPNSTFGINGNSGEIVDMQQLGVWEPYAVKVMHPAGPSDAGFQACATSDFDSGINCVVGWATSLCPCWRPGIEVQIRCCAAAGANDKASTEAIASAPQVSTVLTSVDALCPTWQVQTIKTSIEAACLLLRIDDIVSGIAKKSRGSEGPQMQQQPQTEDADGVSRHIQNRV